MSPLVFVGIAVGLAVGLVALIGIGLVFVAVGGAIALMLMGHGR